MLNDNQRAFLRTLLSRARSGGWAAATVIPDEVRSGAGPDDRDPARIGSAVDALVRQRGWQDNRLEGSLSAHWADVVGSEIAAHTKLTRIDLTAAPQLTIQADSTAWATQLRLMSALIANRANEHLGDPLVTEVLILAPTAPSWSKGLRRVPGRGPRDTYG